MFIPIYQSNVFIILEQSNWTNTAFPHLKVSQGSQVREKNAQHHKTVPNLMTVSARVVTARVLSLRASSHIHIQPSQVRSSEE